MKFDMDLTVEELELLEAPLIPRYYWYPIIILAIT